MIDTVLPEEADDYQFGKKSKEDTWQHIRTVGV